MIEQKKQSPDKETTPVKAKVLIVFTLNVIPSDVFDLLIYISNFKTSSSLFISNIWSIIISSFPTSICTLI